MYGSTAHKTYSILPNKTRGDFTSEDLTYVTNTLFGIIRLFLMHYVKL